MFTGQIPDGRRRIDLKLNAFMLHHPAVFFSVILQLVMIFMCIWTELSGDGRRVRVGGASLVGGGAVCVNKKTVHVFDASCESWQRTNIQYYQK